ncbi:hypothetical protein IHEIED_01857 [Methylorubrum populi]
MLEDARTRVLNPMVDGAVRHALGYNMRGPGPDGREPSLQPLFERAYESASLTHQADAIFHAKRLAAILKFLDVGARS